MLSSGRKLTGAGIGRSVVSALAISAMLPIEAGHANWLSDIFSSKHDKSSKHSASPRRATTARHIAPSRHRDTSPVAAATSCYPLKFRIILDVGHTAESDGATSARNLPEYTFNLRLAQQVAEKLKAAGFAATRLLVTGGKARPSLVRRVASANNWPADLFLSIHHDSVPDKMLEDWEFEGKKSHFSDRFSGYSVFVSRDNPDFRTSLAFAELLGKEMKARGLQYARQYTQAIMGHYQHPILNKETGIYSYDDLIVLKKTRMPAVLLEAGSIINRDEELKMASPERRDIISSGVATAMKKFCDARSPARAAGAVASTPEVHPAEMPKPEQASQ